MNNNEVKIVFNLKHIKHNLSNCVVGDTYKERNEKISPYFEQIEYELIQLKAENEQLNKKNKELDSALTFQLESLALSSTGRELLKTREENKSLIQKLEKAREYFKVIVEDGSGYEYNDTSLAQQALKELEE